MDRYKAPLTADLKRIVERIAERQAEPRWAREKRFQSLLAFEEIPMPLGTEETWRRTDIRSLRPESFLPTLEQRSRGAQVLGSRGAGEQTNEGAERRRGGGVDANSPQHPCSLSLPSTPAPLLLRSLTVAAPISSPAPLLTYAPLLPRTPAPPPKMHPRSKRGGLLIQEDAHVLLSHVSEELEAQGVIFCDLGTALASHPDLVREYFIRACVSPTESKLTAMNGAFWCGGVLLYVPAGLEVSLPFQAIYRIGKAGAGAFPHTLIVAGQGSSAAYIEEYISPPDGREALSNAVVEIFLEEGAQLCYTALQRWGEGVFHFSTQRAMAKRDSCLRWIDCTLGGRLTKSYLECLLLEPGARVDQTGLFFGTKNQHMDFSPFLHHKAPHTTGEVLFKGALKGKARSVFQGLIRVEKEARQTDSFLTNHNLILSEKGRADSIPRLEIENNDVRCSHAVTAGRVDEEQIFYLMSRGLPEREAIQLIVSGFFEEVYRRIPLEEERERFRAALQEKVGEQGSERAEVRT